MQPPPVRGMHARRLVRDRVFSPATGVDGRMHGERKFTGHEMPHNRGLRPAHLEVNTVLQLALCAAAMSHPAVGWPPSAVVDILGYGMAATSVASLGLYAREGLAKASRCGVGRQLVFIILFLTCSAR